MSRRPATITQADIARAIRAAKQAGAAEVELTIGSEKITIRIQSSTATEITLADTKEIVL